MKVKKASIIYTIVIVVLIISIVVVVETIMPGKAKEYIEAKNVMEVLQDNNAIDSNFNVNKSEYEVLKENNKDNGFTRYTVMTSDYGIALDSEYKLIGFQNKNISSTDNNISEEDAIILANKYISILTDDNLLLNGIKTKNNEDDSTYTIGYTKTYNNYEIFGQEALVKINKSTGFLEGYNNIPLNNLAYTSEISVDKDKAIEIATTYFNKLNVRLEKFDDPKLVYFMKGNDIAKLSYLFEVEMIDNENITHKNKVFISAKTGEIINTIDDAINKANAQ